MHMCICMYVQLGVAIGFLLPTMMVRNHEELDDIAHDLSVMYYTVAGFTTLLLVLIILCEYNNVTTLTNYSKQMLPLGHFPPGSLRRTLLDKSSTWYMTCPAHLNLFNLQNFTMSFSPHN